MNFFKIIATAILAMNLTGCWVLLDENVATKAKELVIGKPEVPVNNYPGTTRNNFIKACNAESELKLCVCLIDGIQNELTHQEFLIAEKTFVRTGRYPQNLQIALEKSADACFQR